MGGAGLFHRADVMIGLDPAPDSAKVARMPQRKARRWSGDALGIGLLFVAYLATARLGLRMDAVAGFATLVWPPTGISLAALLLFGRQLWPGVFLGALCANLLAGAPPAVAFGIGAGNAFEALAGSWLLREVTGFSPRLERVSDVVSLVLFGAVGSTALSAAVGVLSLRLGSAIPPALTWPALRAWWLGDMLGDLVVAPVLFVWISRPPLPRRRSLPAEAVLLAAALVGASTLVFAGAQDADGLLRQPYVIFPVLLWAAVRFAQYGAASGTLLVSAIAIAGTAMRLGPYVRGTLAEGLLYLQTFLGVTAATALTVAAAIAERMRAVDARDEFLAIASHELRTPLTALLLHVQNQLRSVRRSGAPASEKAAEQLESTQRMVLRLGKLIGELLEVSRIVWGRFQPERQDVDLAALVQESLARMEEQLARAGCAVQVAVEGGVRGSWDRDRLDRVVDNLIGNAVKYGAGKPIEVRLRGRDGDVLIEVRDYGIGIDPADQARVFERFERAVSRRQFGGFGLGLWISRKIVEAHGGSITLTSRPGAGSTFSIELPR
jgi:signal transduction histidine kinase